MHEPSHIEFRKHLSSIAAAGRMGRRAAAEGLPMTACPFVLERELPLAAEWRNGWTMERGIIRARRVADAARAAAKAAAETNRLRHKVGVKASPFNAGRFGKDKETGDDQV